MSASIFFKSFSSPYFALRSRDVANIFQEWHFIYTYKDIFEGLIVTSTKGNYSGSWRVFSEAKLKCFHWKGVRRSRPIKGR